MVSSSESETGVDLIFQDNGIGIPYAEKKKIFEGSYDEIAAIASLWPGRSLQ